MKTIEELMKEFYCFNGPQTKVDRLIKFIKDIQSDAFHAGKLSGLADAAVIVRNQNKPDGSLYCDMAADAIDLVCESLEKK